jgi:hypothetical protein
MQPGYRSFHDPTRFSKAAAVRLTSFGNDGLNAFCAQLISMRLRVIAPVGLDNRRLGFGVSHFALDGWNTFNQRYQLGDIMAVRAGEENGKRNALRIRDEVVFAPRFSSVRGIFSSFFPPHMARMEPESTTARDQSRRLLACSSANRISWSRCQTFAFCQSRSRRQQVMPDPHPISCGNISQGIPDLSTKRMPRNATRFGTRGRPPFRRGGSMGSNGSILDHSSSVTNSFAISISKVADAY